MILVTGASGFVGQHLVRQLSASGKEVRALYNRSLPGEDLRGLDGITWQACDLLDVFAVDEACSGITEIYHCAAIVSFDPARRKEVLHHNIESTANVVNASLEHNIRKLVYVSSIASLGRAEEGELFINEEAEWEESKRNSIYSLSKYYAEMEVWRGIGEGLDAVIINPGIILGAGDWTKGSAKLMQVVADEFPFYTEGINAFVDVADVVSVMQQLMDSTATAERFIVCAGNFAYRDIFTQMAQALGKKPPRIKASAFLTGLVWRWSLLKHKITGGEPTITKETVRNAQTKCYYDNKRLLQVLPSFNYTPMPETIRQMAAAFLKK